MHSRLLSDLSNLLTVCNSPSSNFIIIPAQEMFSIGVECDCVYKAGATGIKYYYLALLNGQHCSITPRSHYAPVFIDDILTNCTQSWSWECERTRDFGSLVLCKVLHHYVSLFALFTRSLLSLAPILTATCPRCDDQASSRYWRCFSSFQKGVCDCSVCLGCRTWFTTSV